jgi:hypothetical protein
MRVIKSERMGWTGHIGRMGERRNAFKILVQKPDLEFISVDAKIILKWILEKRGVRRLNGFIWPRIGTSGGLL